jgi:two-component system OmpR family response regulator
VSNVTNIRSFVSRRVLVVEDNLDAVHSMAVLIKMMGHECQFAINGFAALKIAREFRPEEEVLGKRLGAEAFPTPRRA